MVSASAALALAIVQFAALRFSNSELLVRIVLPATIAAVPAALWVYRDRLGVWIICVGAAANLAAILANGGLMPIRHETVVQAVGVERAAEYQVGSWIEGSKDVLVADDGGRLTALGDQIVLSAGGAGMAVSPGDIVIWVGLLTLIGEFSWAWHSSRGSADTRGVRTAEGGATT